MIVCVRPSSHKYSFAEGEHRGQFLEKSDTGAYNSGGRVRSGRFACAVLLACHETRRVKGYGFALIMFRSFQRGRVFEYILRDDCSINRTPTCPTADSGSGGIFVEFVALVLVSYIGAIREKI